ncbi:MAG: PAS domain S-box protein [Candidatus Cloacimonetes bacterium]|nr:PAS domain S-box protein [Candidatus Cloacimonadota bacterium]
MNKILIIDDTKENLEAVKDSLELLIPNCVVITTDSGKEGLKVAKDVLPDVIISDVVMPEMNGIEVCKRLKKDEKTKLIPIIIHTGSKTDADTRIQCLEAGADVFLAKPIDAGELTAQINAMLRIKKAEDKLRAEKEQLDVSVYKRTNELKESEEALTLVIENIPFAVFAHNLDGEFILVNKTSSDYTGYTKRELLKMRVSDVDHQSITRDFRKNIWEKLQYGEHEQVFSTHYRKDGSQYPVEVHITAITLRSEPIIIAIVQDITERKLVEKALAESGQLNRTVIENSPIGISVRDKNGTLLLSNKAWKTLWGSSEKDISAAHQKRNKLVFDEKDSYLHDHLDEIRRVYSEGGQYFIQDVQLSRNKENKAEWISQYFYSIVDEKGEVEKVIILTEDVTERKHAEEKLKRSEQNLRALFRAMTDIVLELDREGRYINIAPTSPDLLYKPAAEILGKTLHEIFPLNEADKFLSVIHKSLDEDRIVKIEYPLKIKNKVIWFEGRATPKTPNTVLYIAHDITERKEAERIQKTLFNISNALNTTDNINELYSKIREFLGDVIDTTNFYIALYNEKTDMISLPFDVDEKDAFDTFPAGKTITKYVIKTGKSLFATKDVVKKLIKNGLIETIGSSSEIWLGVPLKLENKVIGVIAVQSYDDPNLYTEKDIEILNFISEEIALAINRKQAEDELKVNRERLKTANSILRHDIANDLIVIKSALDIYHEEQDKTMLEEIDKRVEKSLITIKHQREQERFLDSHSDLNEYQIDNVIKEIIKDYPDIAFNVTGTGKAYADNAIYSVFENIINNAEMHAKSTKLDIDITYNEDYCDIKFADDGIGIPDEIKHKVFDKGFQFGKNGHTGIGLYIVKKTIDDYGGEVFIQNNTPKGAVFVIRLKKTIGR